MKIKTDMTTNTRVKFIDTILAVILSLLIVPIDFTTIGRLIKSFILLVVFFLFRNDVIFPFIKGFIRGMIRGFINRR